MHDPPSSANSSKQGSVPRRYGPCRPQRFETNSAGSQIQCLGRGAWAEQTALVPGAQTVSTTQIRIDGNCVGKRRQNGTDTDALTKGPPLCRAEQRTHQSDTHPGPRRGHIIRARSVLAQSANQGFE